MYVFQNTLKDSLEKQALVRKSCWFLSDRALLGLGYFRVQSGRLESREEAQTYASLALPASDLTSVEHRDSPPAVCS